jgi:hypothetical protein
VRFYDQAAASGTNWVWASWTSVLNDHRCGVVLFSPTNIDSVGGLEFTDSTFIPFLVVPDERSALFARAYWKIGFHKALATRAGFRGVRFTRDSYSVAEGGLLDVVLERLGGTVDPLEVLLRTEEVSAKEGVDYRPITTPVVFNPGERTKHIQLAALDDAEVEGEETVRLRAEWNDSEGPQRTWVPVTIIDNDGLPEIRSIRITPNQVVLTSTSIPGYSYGVEVTTWLPGAAWTPTVLLPATTNVIDLAVPISDNTYDFYRVFRK